MSTSVQPCKRHQIQYCVACTRVGYSNETMAAPRKFKPHIAFVLGYWRVSALSPVLQDSLTKPVKSRDVIMERWERAHRKVLEWNALNPERRALAPWIWPLKL